jgi:hypothetical protein
MRWRRVTFFVLCLSMIWVSAVFGIPYRYSPPVSLMLTVVGLAAVSMPALALAVGMAADNSPSRTTAIGGVALVLPIGLFAFLPGFGPPDAVSASENYLRYIVLLAGSVALGMGLLLISATAEERGSIVFGRLSRAAAVLATPLYIVWATVLIEIVRIIALPARPEAGPWLRWVSDWSDIVLFAAGLLTYVSAAALSTALSQIGNLGKRTALAFTSVSLIGGALLLMRGVAFPAPTDAFRHWYTVPGWIAGIPAVPWMVPAFLGAICLRPDPHPSHSQAD